MLTAPSIVIVAHKRTHCLKRLMHSLLNASYPDGQIDLIISIDKSKSDAVLKLAEDFNWTHGEKQIIKHPLPLGLLNHMLFVFSLTEKYENLIILEDDLWVSPCFYQYAQKALNYYQSDNKITGISLYSYNISESSLLGFVPVDDGSDVYFMSYPSSWGLCVNKYKISNFINDFNNGLLNECNTEPSFVKNWGKQSWKRYMIRYLIKSESFFVFPRLSLTSNFSPKGANTPTHSEMFQVNIQNIERKYNFINYSQSKAIYDSYFEPTTDCLNSYIKKFFSFNYTIDLQGVKENKDIPTPYVLTIKKTKKPLFQYGSFMKPIILNVIHDIKGTSLSFDTKENIISQARKIHYGHTEFIHKYTYQMLRSRLSFVKYFYFYLKFEIKIYWQKIFG